MPTINTCSIAGCDKPYKAKGMCNAHYIKAIRRGEIVIKHWAKNKTTVEDSAEWYANFWEFVKQELKITQPERKTINANI